MIPFDEPLHSNVPSMVRFDRSLEAERALSELYEQLPDTLTLNRSLTELRATADAYARLDSEHHNGGD